ncbi:MAG: polysaccharide deacetylase family protein [Nitrospirae bacterium YQR-1]
MYYLKVCGYKVVSLTDIFNFSLGQPSDSILVAITFDDGFKSFIELAFPILNKYNFPAAIFLVSSLVGKHNEWDCVDLKDTKEMMDWSDIEFLKKQGFEFGAHSRTHPSLPTLSDTELEAEVRGCKDDLQSALDLPVDFFCYPYGDYDSRVIRSIKESGFKGAFTTKKGYIYSGDDPFEFKRMSIKLNTGPLAFTWKLLR